MEVSTSTAAVAVLVALAMGGAAYGAKARTWPAPVRLDQVASIVVYNTDAPGAMLFQAGMAIDADGAPNAYKPDNTGIDDLAFAGRPGNWWALATDTGMEDGTPVLQGTHDPFPGYYVSMTALADLRYEHTDPHRYVDARAIPYVVLPPGLLGAGRASLGDFAMVVNQANGRKSPAIVADIGPPTKLGEGSIALAKALQIPADPRVGGVEDGVQYVVFPGSGNAKPRSMKEIRREATRLFNAWGGLPRLASALPGSPPAKG